VDAGDGSAAVVFEVELAFHRVKPQLDPLVDTAELPEPGFLVFVVGPDEEGSESNTDECFEVLVGRAVFHAKP
jgi:hypothetical protein